MQSKHGLRHGPSSSGLVPETQLTTEAASTEWCSGDSEVQFRGEVGVGGAPHLPLRPRESHDSSLTI